MRRVLLPVFLVALFIFSAFSGACGGTHSTADEGGVEGGTGPVDGGDAQRESGRHMEGGLPTDASDASDARSEGGKEAGGPFTIGGTVTGLAGSGLVLQDNGGDNLTISGNGPFTFATPLASGMMYGVAVLTQPSSPSQNCVVTGGSGMVASTNVTSIVVNCAADTYTISGTVYGLSGTVVLQDNGKDNLDLSAPGAFVFKTPIANGNPYAVTILTQPTTQTCSVMNGGGTVTGANVTNVVVSCTNPTFTVGGKVSGLTGTGLVLENNGGDDLAVSSNGSFTFPTGLLDGSMYDVTVSVQPTAQYCTVSGATGTVSSSNVTSVSVTCAAAVAYTIGGTVSGLILTDGGTDQVVLQDNGGDNLTVSANGGFTFPTSVYQGHPYSVTVFTNPSTPAEYCFVTNGAGTVSYGPVSNVQVMCYSAASGGCGRFSSGFTGSWTTTGSSDPASSEMGFSGYAPVSSPATLYVNYLSEFWSYDSTSDTYTSLPAPPVAFQGYGSTAVYAGAVWAITSGSVIRYDLSSGTWSTPASGLGTAFENQTTYDDSGNIWSYSSGTQLVAYNVAASTSTTYSLAAAYISDEPRITWDSCNQRLYLTQFFGSSFYSYDPATSTQTLLSALPYYADFQDGFCGDRSGHIFAVTNSSPTVYQYTISTDTWTALPTTGGPTTLDTSACGVGADGYLYVTDPSESSAVYKIQLN